MQTTATITTRTRNLGYAWSTTRLPERPDVVGTVTTVRRAMVERSRLISPGTYYHERLFIGGIPASDHEYRVHEILNAVEVDDGVDVILNPPLTAGEAAQLLGVSRRTVLDWHEAGKFPCAWRTSGGKTRRGNLRIPADDVRDLREEQEQRRTI